MRLQQNQLWRGEDFSIRITRLERLAVGYFLTRDETPQKYTRHQATKKEFCRLLKTCTLVPGDKL